jgi:hypothetical protein
MMRYIPLFSFVLCLVGVVTARADEVEPYAAQVAANDAPVHSGPGRNYYVTGRLRRGAEVEVYRHDAGGWLAIRPPEGSFSLVGSRYLRRNGDGLATILDDQVGARVGSLESPDRDVVQVRLSRGEEVQLLEPEPVTSPSSKQTWYMISPPAGEFRWIHESQVTGGASIAEPTVRPRRLPEEHDVFATPVAEDVEEQFADEPIEREAESRGTKLATYQIDKDRAPTRRPAEPAPEEEGWTSADRPAAPRPRPREVAERPRTTAAAAAPASSEPRPTRGGSLRAELDSIELALSQMVAQDSSQWDFTDINRRAEKLLNQSATAIERGRSRMLLRKIARFEDIAQGYADVRRSGMQSSRPIAPVNTLPSAPSIQLPTAPPILANSRATNPRYANPGDADPADDEDFVGTGRLTQVMSRRPGAPMFALVDENRQVRYFVAPSAGINLRSYVGKQVGIHGLATTQRDYSKQVLTAERIDILSDSILRR